MQQQLVLSPRCGHLRGNGGVKAAVRFAQRLTHHCAYVARFDIRHDYESVDHRVMLAQCRHVSPDVFDVVQDYLCTLIEGEPAKAWWQGGAISPLLGGLYLTPLDRAMEDLCKKNWIRYQRFMDDYVIFAKTCHKLKAAIKRMCAVLDTLQLTVHPDKR